MALTLSARRKSVATSRMVGKTANSSGLCTFIATSSTSSAMAMLSAISRSSSIAGSGTTIITTMTTMPAGTPSWSSRLEATEGAFRGTSS